MCTDNMIFHKRSSEENVYYKPISVQDQSFIQLESKRNSDISQISKSPKSPGPKSSQKKEIIEQQRKVNKLLSKYIPKKVVVEALPYGEEYGRNPSNMTLEDTEDKTQIFQNTTLSDRLHQPLDNEENFLNTFES